MFFFRRVNSPGPTESPAFDSSATPPSLPAEAPAAVLPAISSPIAPRIPSPTPPAPPAMPAATAPRKSAEPNPVAVVILYLIAVFVGAALAAPRFVATAHYLATDGN